MSINISINSIVLFLLLIFYLYLIFNSVFVRTFEGLDNEDDVPSTDADSSSNKKKDELTSEN
jgi:hypothetical protein